VNGPTVLKLGGSFAFSPHLRAWIRAIVDGAGRAIIVPGGGPFADTVRMAQAPMGFDDRAAHRMGLLAMEQYGCAIGSVDERLQLADSLEAIHQGLMDGKVPVWLPAKMALGDAGIPPSWDVTSDSLAAWLAGKIGARRLLLPKHAEVKEKTVRAADLVARDIVDRAFGAFLTASGVPAFILGPQDHGALSSREPAGARIIVDQTAR
jgi:5-(aminomethyl)-3-furanmethanol phosphate kinase